MNYRTTAALVAYFLVALLPCGRAIAQVHPPASTTETTNQQPAAPVVAPSSVNTPMKASAPSPQPNATGNNGQPPAVTARAMAPAASEPELRIGSGDVLEVKVYSMYGQPDMTQSTRVSNTGEISLPLIGELKVAGLTADEAQTVIERKYKDGGFLKNPHVSVFLAEYASEGVSVFGEVAKPGIYPVVAARTVLDVLSAAGGLTPMAGNQLSVTHKAQPSASISVTVVAGGGPEPNVKLQPGDTVVVNKAGIVYVVGDVTKPGGYPITDRLGLSVLQAIALAEGTAPNAATNASKLIRKDAGKLAEVPIPLKKILEGNSPDVKLRAGDIVFVPNSPGKGIAKRSLEAIVQTATGVAIYSSRRY